MPQGQGSRLRARRRRVLFSHGRPLFPQKGPKSAIATWNLRRLGTGNWGETSWLKMKMLTRIALQRGWRSVLISDCGAEGKGTYEFKGFGGSWLVIFNGRCGILLDPGMARVWRRGGAKRFDSPDGRSIAAIPVLPFPAFLPKRQGRALKDKEKGPKGKENPNSLPFRGFSLHFSYVFLAFCVFFAVGYHTKKQGFSKCKDFTKCKDFFCSLVQVYK